MLSWVGCALTGAALLPVAQMKIYWKAHRKPVAMLRTL